MALALLLLLALLEAQAPLWSQAIQQNSPAETAKSPDPNGLVIEKYDTVVLFQADGTGERTRTLVARVESEAAVRQLGVLAFSFNSSVERLTVDYVRVRKSDGSTVETPASNFQETPSPATASAPMYSDVRAMQIPVRSLGVGDQLEYRVRWTQTKDDIPNEFWYAHDFITDGTVKQETLSIDVPAGQYVKVASPGIEPKITEQNSRKMYFWSSSHAATDKEKQETNASVQKKPAHSVEITTLKSWQEIGRWYAALAGPMAAVTPAIQAKAAELTRGVATTAEKERAIYDYVSTKFRYVSIALGDARYQPHAADEVLANLYGDCKDKDTLLRALLKAAGIDAWPALIGADIPFDANIPSLAAFNHVITFVPGPDGKSVWLDTTPEVAPFGVIVKSLRDKQALVIPASGAPRLMTTPPDAAISSTERFQVKGTLSAEGTLTGHIEVTETGDNDLVLRTVFHQLNPAQWELAVQQMSYNMGFAGKVSAIDISNPQDTSKPFRMAWDYTREKYSDWAELQITPPFPPTGLPGPETKPSEPVEMEGTSDSNYDATITLPAGYSVEIPGPVRASNDAVEYECRYSVTGSVLTAHRAIRIKKDRVAVEEWPEYRKTQMAVNDSIGHFIRLSHTGGPTQVSVVADNPEAAALVASALDDLRRGEMNTGRDALEQAQRLNAKQQGLWAAWATFYGMNNNVDKAIESLRQEVGNHPDELPVYRALARAARYYKRDAEEEAAWRGLLKVSPTDPEASMGLSAILIRQKRFDDALTATQKALDASPQDITLQTVREEALLRAGRKTEGVAMAREIAAHSPSAAQLNDVAWFLADTQAEGSLAREYAGRAVAQMEDGLKDVRLSRLEQEQIRKEASLGAAWDTLAWALFDAGEYRAAEKYAEASWKLTQRGGAGDHLGQIYEKEGRRKDAIAVWTLALSADSHLEGAKERLDKASPPRIIAKDKKMTTLQLGPPHIGDAEALGKMRTVGLPGFVRTQGTAEFFVLLSPKGVEDAEFISGDEALRAAKEALMRGKFDQPFPDNGPEKIARRGIVSCSQYTAPNCQFTMLLLSNTTVQ